MISYISGKIIDISGGRCIVLVNDIGYGVSVLDGVLSSVKESENISLWTYMSVRETSMELFGFREKSELIFFQKLLGISGIGPRSAVGIMSLAPVETLHGAITKGDLGYLTKVSGIGKKTAEKIVFELKDKLKDLKIEGGETSDHDSDVLDALLSLGYSAYEAREAVHSIDPSIEDLNKRVAEALKMLQK